MSTVDAAGVITAVVNTVRRELCPGTHILGLLSSTEHLKLSLLTLAEYTVVHSDYASKQPQKTVYKYSSSRSLQNQK